MRRNMRTKAIIQLVRNSTYHCGRIERYVVNYLRRARRKVAVKELIRTLKPFKPSQRDVDELVEAIQRLAKRNIITLHNI